MYSRSSVHRETDIYLKIDLSLFNSVSSLLAISQKSQQERDNNQQNLFGSDLNNKNESVILNDQVSWNKTECLMNEYYSLGYFISINPLIKERPFFENFKLKYM